MSHREALTQDLKDIETINFIAGVLTEISAKRMGELRESFNRNRSFYDELWDLYAIVKSNAVNKTLLNKVGRQPLLTLALTSNHRFFGSLNTDAINAFFGSLRASHGDALIIGHTGKSLVEEYGKGFKARNLIFKDDMPTAGELKVLFNIVARYDRAIFFYPRFDTLLHQSIGKIDTEAHDSAGPILNIKSKVDINEQKNGIEGSSKNLSSYIFEPELSEMLDFFEHEIKRIVVSRVFLESEMARTAARLATMSRAEENAGDRIRDLRIVIRKAVASDQNMRLLEAFSGYGKWQDQVRTL